MVFFRESKSPPARKPRSLKRAFTQGAVVVGVKPLIEESSPMSRISLVESIVMVAYAAPEKASSESAARRVRILDVIGSPACGVEASKCVGSAPEVETAFGVAKSAVQLGMRAMQTACPARNYLITRPTPIHPRRACKTIRQIYNLRMNAKLQTHARCQGIEL